MTKLIKLQNGDWVDPACIKSIRYAEKVVAFPEGFYPPRVIVDHGWTSVVDFESPHDAIAYRDELAAAINEIRLPALK